MTLIKLEVKPSALAMKLHPACALEHNMVQFILTCIVLVTIVICSKIAQSSGMV